MASKIVQRDFFDFYANRDDIPAEILFLALLSLHDHLDVVAALQEYILEEVGNLFATEVLHELLVAGIVIETETSIVGKNSEPVTIVLLIHTCLLQENLDRKSVV